MWWNRKGRIQDLGTEGIGEAVARLRIGVALIDFMIVQSSERKMKHG